MLPLLMVFLAAGPGLPTPDIKVDQAGYPSKAPKIAAVAAKAKASRFAVKRAGDDKVVLKGQLTAATEDRDSGDKVQLADFSKLSRPGTYYVEVDGTGHSYSFAIGPAVYERAFYLAMRSYYGQRCGVAVDLGEEFPGYKHEACHLEGAYHATSGKSGAVKSAGGWHDAGDYGRYVVNSGITTGTLLWTWELYGQRLRALKLDLPESGNGVPDILNEIRWNLNWMLAMQDGDGGVFHKQTSEKFCGFVMPEKDALVSYIIGTGAEPYKSSCATGDFAAVMAIAARVYKPFDPAFAARCLKAAEDAWKWLDGHPEVRFMNPKGVSTGAYGDRSCADESLWAAAELWRTTGAAAYQTWFLANYEKARPAIRPEGPPSWANVGALALWTYAMAPGADAAGAANIRKDSFAAADAIVERTAQHPYRMSMTTKDYIWGSNAVAANYGLQLLVANALRKDTRYVDAAIDNLHYLLGRNALSLSFVTQLGENPYHHPHHRPSGADANAEPWPGLLAGGPNGRRQDPAMAKLPGDLPPARMYLDEQASYATNEVAINWNAPLVFLLAGALAR